MTATGLINKLHILPPHPLIQRPTVLQKTHGMEWGRHAGRPSVRLSWGYAEAAGMPGPSISDLG